MHEEVLLQDLRRKLEEIAERERAERIVRVALWVGALAHVTEATLRARWAGTVQGTAAEHARLEVETSTDLAHPRATGIVLARVDVSDGAAGSGTTELAPGEVVREPDHSDGAPPGP